MHDCRACLTGFPICRPTAAFQEPAGSRLTHAIPGQGITLPQLSSPAAQEGNASDDSLWDSPPCKRAPPAHASPAKRQRRTPEDDAPPAASKRKQAPAGKKRSQTAARMDGQQAQQHDAAELEPDGKAAGHTGRRTKGAGRKKREAPQEPATGDGDDHPAETAVVADEFAVQAQPADEPHSLRGTLGDGSEEPLLLSGTDRQGVWPSLTPHEQFFFDWTDVDCSFCLGM